ncbi:MAG: ribonuclease P protein component [Elusimicrobiota bacterium]|jgi:ribonuclease P protein component|nr:ribonuclease P protein component [Elusimicrobiota bacterium]
MQKDKACRKNLSFNYLEKLHLQKDFKMMFQKGLKFDASVVKILAYKREGVQIRRLGLITSRKAGNAVERNLAKRRLREIFRTNKRSLVCGLDLIFISKPKIADMKYRDLQKMILDILANARLYKR